MKKAKEKVYKFKDDIVGCFFKFVTLAYNGSATLLSLVFLIVSLVLKRGSLWIQISLIVFTTLNMVVTLLSVFVFYSKSSKRALKFVKSGISAMRLVVTVINMGFTISMWFSQYSKSGFITALLVVFTVFYAFATIIQLLLLAFKFMFLSKKKAKQQKKT